MQDLFDVIDKSSVAQLQQMRARINFRLDRLSSGGSDETPVAVSPEAAMLYKAVCRMARARGVQMPESEGVGTSLLRNTKGLLPKLVAASAAVEELRDACKVNIDDVSRMHFYQWTCELVGNHLDDLAQKGAIGDIAEEAAAALERLASARTLTQTVRTSLRAIAMQLNTASTVARHRRSHGVPSILGQLTTISELVERNFPSYAGAGLLPFIFRHPVRSHE